jgi:hypothetical protein
MSTKIKVSLSSLGPKEKNEVIAFLRCLGIAGKTIIDICGSQARDVLSNTITLARAREKLLRTAFNPKSRRYYLASVEGLTDFSAALLVFAKLYARQAKLSLAQRQVYVILEKYLKIEEIAMFISGLVHSSRVLERPYFLASNRGYEALIREVCGKQEDEQAKTPITPLSIFYGYLDNLTPNSVLLSPNRPDFLKSLADYYWSTTKTDTMIPRISSEMMQTVVMGILQQYLTPEEMRVISVRYIHAPDGVPVFHREVGTTLDMTKDRATDLHISAMKKLRQEGPHSRLAALVMPGCDLVESAVKDQQAIIDLAIAKELAKLSIDTLGEGFVRFRNVCKRQGVTTLGQLVALGDAEIRRWPTKPNTLLKLNRHLAKNFPQLQILKMT